MNTYPTTPPSEFTENERIPNGMFGYLRARNRHRLYSLIIEEFKKSGLSQAELARRSGKPPETICRWLATLGNIRVDSLSDLLFAISGAVPTYGLDYPLEKPARNDTRPEWLDQSTPDKKLVGTPPLRNKPKASSAVDAANTRRGLANPIDRDATTQLSISSTATTRQQKRAESPIDLQLERVE